MSDDVEFVESKAPPVCPHCEAVLKRVEYRRQKLSLGGFTSGATWVIILTCPVCHKVLGTQGWD